MSFYTGSPCNETRLYQQMNKIMGSVGLTIVDFKKNKRNVVVDFFIYR